MTAFEPHPAAVRKRGPIHHGDTKSTDSDEAIPVLAGDLLCVVRNDIRTAGGTPAVLFALRPPCLGGENPAKALFSRIGEEAWKWQNM